jgi:hypothetical protein
MEANEFDGFVKLAKANYHMLNSRPEQSSELRGLITCDLRDWDEIDVDTKIAIYKECYRQLELEGWDNETATN